MTRMRYKMRKVVREFTGPMPNRPASLPSVELECGHVKRDPWNIYGNELSVRVQAAVHTIAPTVRKCRCYQCGGHTGNK